MLKSFLARIWNVFRDLPGEDGLCSYQVDDPHDPQTTRRTVPDDNFNFERWKP